MGSPLTFWKLQQVPVLWVLDRMGRGPLIDDPIRRQAELLPLVRAGALWIWLAALGLTAWWSRRLYGNRAMVLAAWLFALSPNLIAHGALATMELPLVACVTGMLFLFWIFLTTGSRRCVLVLGGRRRPGVLLQVHRDRVPADPRGRLVASWSAGRG